MAEGLTVRATEELARQRGGRARPPPPARAPARVGDAALEAFGTAFDAPVRVRAGPRTVRWSSSCASPDEDALEAALRLGCPPAR